MRKNPRSAQHLAGLGGFVPLKKPMHQGSLGAAHTPKRSSFAPRGATRSHCGAMRFGRFGGSNDSTGTPGPGPSELDREDGTMVSPAFLEQVLSQNKTPPNPC